MWASHWLVAVCAFYKLISFVAYSFFPLFRPRLARLYDSTCGCDLKSTILGGYFVIFFDRTLLQFSVRTNIFLLQIVKFDFNHAAATLRGDQRHSVASACFAFLPQHAPFVFFKRGGTYTELSSRPAENANIISPSVFFKLVLPHPNLANRARTLLFQIFVVAIVMQCLVLFHLQNLNDQGNDIAQFYQSSCRSV